MKIAQNKDGSYTLFPQAQKIWKAYYHQGRCGSSYYENDEYNDIWVDTDDPVYESRVDIGEELDIEIPEMFNGDADAFAKDLNERYGWELIYWNDNVQETI